jgi:hypothetical protein
MNKSIYLIFIIIIVFFIIFYLNKILKKNENFLGNNCTTYDGKIGYINNNICVSNEEKLSKELTNTLPVITSPTNYTTLYDANNYCNTKLDSTNIASYGMKEVINNTDGSFRVVCQKNYPKTYITPNYLNKTSINNSTCITSFPSVSDISTYGIKGLILKPNDNTKTQVQAVCSKGYSITPCLPKKQDFNNWCQYYTTESQLNNSTRDAVGVRSLLVGEYNICNNKNEVSAVCSGNNYANIRKINSTVFTDCLPQNTNFEEECKKKVLLDNTTIYDNDGTINYNSTSGLKTFAANVDSYDCATNNMRAKCINNNDINNFENNDRKNFIQKNNVFSSNPDINQRLYL